MKAKPRIEKNQQEHGAVVIGAGIVGLATALELQQRGLCVRIVDIGPPGGRQSASYGHGAWINPASIMPASLPELWKQVPSFLRDPVGPFYLSLFDLPRLAPWLLRFLMAGSNWDKVGRCAVHRYSLCHDAVESHARLAAAACAGDLLKREGLVTVFRSTKSFRRSGPEAALREKFGIVLDELNVTELRAREPDLSSDYTFATSIPNGAYLADTAGYCRALARLFVDRGGGILAGRAIDFDFGGGGLQAVRTDNALIACKQAVICAGVRSHTLARLVGDRVPMASERGYHVQVLGASVTPRHSFILSDGKVAISPQPNGFRVAGQVELAPVDKPPNWKRADIMLYHARRGLPGLDVDAQGVVVDRWMGHRPSTPDGLPVIGFSRRSRDVLYAFGHGHAGPSMAPSTARIVADLAEGSTPGIDPAPYSSRRFGSF